MFYTRRNFDHIQTSELSLKECPIQLYQCSSKLVELIVSKNLLVVTILQTTSYVLSKRTTFRRLNGPKEYLHHLYLTGWVYSKQCHTSLNYSTQSHVLYEKELRPHSQSEKDTKSVQSSYSNITRTGRVFMVVLKLIL